MESIEKNKFANFLKTNIINLVVVLVSIAYVFFSMAVIKRTDLTLGECVAKIGLGTIVGLIVKQGIGENGFSKGYRSDIWNESFAKYNQVCNLANDYIDLIDNFNSWEEMETKKNYRRTTMMSARMRYDWFFDSYGNYKDNNEIYGKLDRKQRRVLKKCINVKVYPLNLLSEYETSVESATKAEKTDKMQRGKMFGKNIFSQLSVAFIGAYFIPIITEWNWGAFCLAVVQVLVWLWTGIIQLYANYNFIVLEKTAKLARKKELLVKFSKGCEQGKYRNNAYEVIENETNI